MKKIIFSLLILGFILVPTRTHAADFYFEQDQKNLASGEGQLVVKIRTGNDNINALSGKIEIPEGMTVSKINTGSSAILLWIEQPKPGKTILFSGITPGGFQGDARLFSMGYSIKSGTKGTLKVIEGEVSRNDGLGSVITNKSQVFSLTRLSNNSTSTEEVDVYSPEVFTVSLGTDSSMFNGAYFASFAAQDKKSGIEKYEWAHTFIFAPKPSDWSEVVSPVALTKGVYFQKIYIKAIDGEGNVRVSTIDGPYHYAVSWIRIIIGLTVLCVLFFYVRRYLYRSS